MIKSLYEVGDTDFKEYTAGSRLIRCCPGIPADGMIKVDMDYEDALNPAERFTVCRQLRYVTNSELMDLAAQDRAIDLSFCYIENFNWPVISNRPIIDFRGEFAVFDGNACFDNAVFQGEGVSFRDAVFGTGNVSFYQTDFGAGAVSFADVQFQKGNVSFAESRFRDGLKIFDYAVFDAGQVTFAAADFGSGYTSFSGAVFRKGDVFFSDTDFGQCDVSFDYTVFAHGRAIFDGSRFRGQSVSFDHTDFGFGEVLFIGTDFGKAEVIFDDVAFGEGNFTLKQAKAADVYFHHCNFVNHDVIWFDRVDSLSLHECILDKILMLSGAKELSLHRTVNLGYLYLDWDRDQVSQAIGRNSDDFEQKCRQLSMLKENYHRLGDYEAEDRAFVEYMRWRRKGLRKPVQLLDWIIDKIGAYGTRPGKVAVSMVMVWSFFTVIFSLMSLLGLMQGTQFNFIESGIYFSSVTFVTIGYGDIVPMGELGRMLAPAEGICGMFLMSYFTVSLVRKTLR